ncbi:PREDICTED: uncharacterized protein LOC105570066 isoform X2 [Vollenhovia emeryi]|uniref:uncharacterized protein LOC105570066 isoform X2 n=1 Tax=Vollenhovia emeryi TaxID=411798 RepID=UPI0005F3CA77|nr:PREDICTED: uncharacterized protein LOC105570066 isoform X2 [Vollenhovia emeryi]
MEKSVIQSKNISLRDLKLLDEETNVEYTIKVQREDYNRAHNDMMFATTLLQRAKKLLSSKDTHNSVSPKNMMANDTSKPSSNITETVVLTDITENILQNNITSDSENASDTQDIEKSDILGKGSHKKMWTEIAKCMKEKKYKFTGSQCNNKMDALKRRYRQITDHNAQSGNDRKEWIYLDVLDDIFQKKHWIKPLAVAGSNVKEPEHSPLTDSDEHELPVKQRKISLNEARVNYMEASLEDKRLKREETANYRATKLQILKEIKEAFENRKQ